MSGSGQALAPAANDDVAATMKSLGRAAKAAAAVLATVDEATKNQALNAAAAAIRDGQADILEANGRDMAAARDKGLSAAMLDRLELNADRVEALAVSLENIVALADPVGSAIDEWTRPNGLHIHRIRTPLGRFV